MGGVSAGGDEGREQDEQEQALGKTHGGTLRELGGEPGGSGRSEALHDSHLSDVEEA